MFTVQQNDPHSAMAELCLDLQKQLKSSPEPEDVGFLNDVLKWPRKPTEPQRKRFGGTIERTIKPLGMTEEGFRERLRDRTGINNPLSPIRESKPSLIVQQWMWIALDGADRRLGKSHLMMMHYFYDGYVDELRVSYPELAKRVKGNYNRSTIIRTANDLEEWGYLKCEHSPTQGGFNRRNRYYDFISLAEERHRDVVTVTPALKSERKKLYLPFPKKRSSGVYATTSRTSSGVAATTSPLEVVASTPRAQSSSRSDHVSGATEKCALPRVRSRLRDEEVEEVTHRRRVRLDDDIKTIKSSRPKVKIDPHMPYLKESDPGVNNWDVFFALYHEKYPKSEYHVESIAKMLGYEDAYYAFRVIHKLRKEVERSPFPGEVKAKEMVMKRLTDDEWRSYISLETRRG
jgi:hypothetical protein